MTAHAAPVILASGPFLYWPLNDEVSGNIVTAAEVIQGSPYEMVLQPGGGGLGDSNLPPRWGALRTRCLGANFLGSSYQDSGITSPDSGEGLLTNAPYVPPTGIDPLIIGVTTWAAEAWISTPETTNLNYDFFTSGGFGGDPSSNTALYPLHGEGHPNDNMPPTGFGLNIGTNGIQLLGHHGAYLQGPSGVLVLSDLHEHHVVVNCVDVGAPSQDFYVYIDGVLVMSDTVWGHDSNLYPIYPPIGVGIGPYTTFFGSIRHFALYSRNLTSTEILDHFHNITCESAISGWKLGSLSI